MKQLKDYTINFLNLKPGIHRFDFEVDNDFFNHFEYSLVQNGHFNVDVELDKQRENFFVLTFHINGEIELECDRCLDKFSYPVKINQRLLVKIESEIPQNDDDELTYLPADAHEIDVAPFIYEYINLQIPLKMSCELIGKECNETMISYLEHVNDKNSTERDPRWEVLAKINKEQSNN